MNSRRHGPAWLLGSNRGLPVEDHVGGIATFHGSIFVSVAVGLNMILVSFAIAWRFPALPLVLWAALELTLVVAGIALFTISRRALLRRPANQSTLRALMSESNNDHRAHHDSLTGLLNRAGLGREISRRKARTDRFALLYLDLDRFKTVNDKFGRQVGDELLRAVAERLLEAGWPGDTIARIGGDEFVILASAADIAAAQSAGERFKAAIAERSFFLTREAAFVGVSVGIALCPDHGRDMGPLLGEADAALYQAKYSGRGGCVVAGTGVVRGPVEDRRPVPYAVAQSRIVQDKAA